MRIYEKLAKLRTGLQPASAYELYNSFLEEAIAKNPRLGNEALIALHKMAECLMQKRSKSLLNLLERYSIIWESSLTVSQALEGCCEVLNDPESAERLTLLLFWFRAKETNSRNITSDEKNLASAAKSAMLLCNRLLEKEQPLPELLPFLLRHFAQDSAIDVRISILQQLPFLMYKQPDLGWQLLADVFEKPQTKLWKYAEKCFYYQYQDNFDKVEPYLNRLLNKGMEEAGDTWGRIATLASLTGHISQEQLFNDLTKNNNNGWLGAAQVFGANLNLREHTTECHSGLVRVLRHKNISDEIAGEIEKCFSEKDNRGLIQLELALAFLDALSAFTGRYHVYHFFYWLGYEAYRNPLSALDVAEVLTEKLTKEMKHHSMGNPKPLIAALNEILREADETDNSELIQRAIRLQDSFLELNVHGIEELLASAGQN
ncbi:MAG: hypothetical protein F6J96_20815 [Symploca sp. SIO1C2]|nr:hypothetical protein [Symploca sp. SIO1C2]